MAISPDIECSEGMGVSQIVALAVFEPLHSDKPPLEWGAALGLSPRIAACALFPFIGKRGLCGRVLITIRRMRRFQYPESMNTKFFG